MPVLSDLETVKADLKTKRDRLGEIFDQAGEGCDLSKVTSLDGDDAAKMKAITDTQAEIQALTKRYTELQAVANAYERTRESGGSDVDTTPATKGRQSLGELFTKSAAFKSHQPGMDSAVATLDFRLKTLMETTNGYPPLDERTGLVVPKVYEPLRITDVVPSRSTTASSITYFEQTAGSDNAAATAEGDTYSEAELEYIERLKALVKITSWLPVTDEQLLDVPGIQALIDNQLELFVRRELARQVASGNGTPPNMSGFLDHAIQEQPLGSLDLVNAILLAITKVQTTGGGEPTAMIVNPLDWYTLRTAEDGTGARELGPATDGRGMVNPWGLPPIVTASMPQGTILVGDFQAYSELVYGRSLGLMVSNSHSDYFVKGKQAIRTDLRAVLKVTRPDAFCKITGIAAPEES